MFKLLHTSLTTAMLITLFQISAIAQITISGKVLDAETNQPLAGASVYVANSTTGVATKPNGEFTITLAQKTGLLTVSYVGYTTQRVQPKERMVVYLEPLISLEQIIIKAVRADESEPVAKSTIQKAELDDVYRGGAPCIFLEELTPSIFSFSESGTKLANYGSMRLRGISQERINFTLNGIPLNDMIDHGVFFSNFSDIGNSFESVQVQRGVGTSSAGAASYAGSVNFESVNLQNRTQSGEIGLSAGSFSTYRLNTNLSTGMIDNKWSFFGNYSKILSDGYRYNTSTNAHSFFFSGGYFGDKDLIKLNVFDARSANGLGYSAVAKSDLDADPRTNYLNENDKDDFGQRLVQLQHTRLLDENQSLITSAYYGGASGDFLFTYADSDSTFAQINFPLRNNHYGLMTTYLFENKDWNISSGVHAYIFDRTNEESITPDFANPYYLETSTKKEFSAFAKAEKKMDKLSVFAEAQFRTMNLSIQPDYSFIGIASEGDISKNWTFINPKIGIGYQLNENIDVYASAGRTGREPTKVDIFGGFNLGASNYAQARANTFEPEYVNDFEAGLNYTSQRATIGANFFFMDFKDEIAPIGEILDFGVQKRDNIANSYRAGVELDWNLLPIDQLAYQGTLTFMKSEIESFTDGAGNTSSNVHPILSPEWIINNVVKVIATDEITMAFSGSYVSQSYLELTNDSNLILPAYFVADVSVRYETDKLMVRLELNNVLDETFYGSGAPVDIDFDGTIDEPGYFINAPRNIMTSLVLKF